VIHKQHWLTLLFILQLTPALFGYYYDAVLVLFGLLLFFTNPERFVFSQRPLFFIIGLIFFSYLLKNFFYLILGSSDFSLDIPKKILSDARIFYIIGLTYFFQSCKAFSYALFVRLALIVSCVSFVVNIVGVFSIDLYLGILDQYFKPYSVEGYYDKFGAVSTAHVAALNGRFSGVFLQPVVAGLVHSSILFMGVVSLIKVRLDWSVILIVCLSIFNGFVSQSTVFELSFIFLLIYLFYVFRDIDKVVIAGGIALLTIIGFTFWHNLIWDYINIDILGLRFSEGSNNARYFSGISLTLPEILFGHVEYLSGKGAGDSGYIIKFVNAGVFYIVVYYLALLYFLKKCLLWKSLNGVSRLFSKSFFSFLMLVEIGVTAFSLPQASLIIYFLLFWFLHVLNKIEGQDRRMSTEISYDHR